MKKALRAVSRRIRARRAVNGLCWGLLIGLALALLLTAASFLRPLRYRNAGLALCCAAPVCGLLIGLLRPVQPALAARTADACGLRERAQTALALLDRQDEMARIQRADAMRALEALDARKALPLKAPVKPLIAAGVCAAVTLALFFLPNPQDGVLRRQEQFAQRMEKPAEAIEKAADALDEKALGEKNTQELRKILGDLAREVRQSREAREALTALSEGQQRMEKLLSESRGAAMEALGQTGLDSLAQAMEADGQALEDALREAAAAEGSEALSGQLGEAAQAAQANAAAASALQAAASAMSQGNPGQAAQALGQLSASGLASGQIASALRSAKAAAGGQGQGQMQGQGQGQGSGGSGQGQGQGQNAGGGAGQGSTNQEMPGSGGQHAAQGSGKNNAAYKLGEYETIYDPTRLGDGGEITQSTGKVDENAQISEMTMGPGLGDASGSVPYDRVVGEYQAAAVQRAQEAALPGYAQQWVADYFSALTDTQ